MVPAANDASSAIPCDASTIGAIRYNTGNSSFEGCNGAAWSSSIGSGGVTLNAILAATAANTIDSTNFAQTWKWSTLNTGTAMSLGANALTSGAILFVSSSSAGVTAGGNAISASLSNAANSGATINVVNASTGTGFGITATLTGAGNTSAAIRGSFSGGGTAINSGVTGTTNATGAATGVTGTETGNSNTGYAVRGLNTPATNAAVNYGGEFESNSTVGGFGVYGKESGASNTGAAGYFNNSGGGAVINYGVEGFTNATGAAYGVYGTETGASNTGYGVYGANTGATNTGYGGYFSNTNGGIALGVNGPLTMSVTNYTTGGTTLNYLAKLNSSASPATAVLAATTDTSGIIGVVMGNAGASGNADIAYHGPAICAFDATVVTAGDYVQISSTVAGKCHDAGATLPTSGEIIGIATQTVASGNATMLVGLQQAVGGAGGGATGSNTQVAFNNSGTESGSSDFTWNDSTKTLTVDAANTTGATLAVGVSGSNTNKIALGPTTGAAAPTGTPVGGITVQTFTTTGANTYTPTAGLIFATFEVVGGGGGGGGVSAVAAGAGGGGGGGYSRKTLSASAITTACGGATCSVTVGVGGSAGANTGGNGNVTTASGSSCVSSAASCGGTVLLTATGGSGGIGDATTKTAVGGGAGGAGSSGDINIKGGPGGFSILASAATTPPDISGAGGSSYLGGGGLGVGTTTGSGNTGGNYGGGGSGANGATANLGGAGAPGIVIVTEYTY